MSKGHKKVRDRVLEYLECYLGERGYPPTYDEIREALGLSGRSHVDYYVRALEQEGLVERRPRTPRGLRLLASTPTSRTLGKSEHVVSDRG